MRTLTAVAALALLSTYALAQGRTYAEPYPYQKSDPARGYTLYQLHGCGDYELLPPARVRHVCDRRSPSQIIKTIDRESHGTAASE